MSQSTSFSSQLRSFGGVFWISNWMELVERFAYYGVRTMLPVFMVAALEAGGPQLDHVQKGSVFAVWALVQSFLPIFTGGFADRYGFKLNIAIATVLKIIGYLGMGYCLILAEMIAGMPVAQARAQGGDWTYVIFFAGAMFQPLAAAITIFAWGVATFAIVPPLQMRVMEAASDAPNLASAVNIGAFNLGNAVGAAVGGGVIGLGLGYPAVSVAGAAMALAGLAIVLATRAQKSPALAEA